MSEPSVVRFKVSAITSKRTRGPSSFTTVRHTPSTATLAPISKPSMSAGPSSSVRVTSPDVASTLATGNVPAVSPVYIRYDYPTTRAPSTRAAASVRLAPLARLTQGDTTQAGARHADGARHAAVSALSGVAALASRAGRVAVVVLLARAAAK